MRLYLASIIAVSLGIGCGPVANDAGDVVTDASMIDVRDGGPPDAPRFDAPTEVIAMDVPMDRTPACGELTATYSYGSQGGLASSIDTSQLTPTNGWHFTRMADDASISCAVAIPPCSSDAGVTMQSVLDALQSPDVTAALATAGTPLFGVDPRPFDGQIWSFRRSDGRGFDVGQPCGSSDACTPIPDGVAVLEGILTALDGQQLMDPSCAALH